MSWNPRILNAWPHSLLGQRVAVADTACLNFDTHGSSAGPRNFAFDEFKGPFRTSDLHNSHLRHSSSHRILHQATFSIACGVHSLINQRPRGGQEQLLMLCPSAIDGLHLCHAAIHKQFRSRDVAAVVGGEKHHGLRDLIRCTEPAERNTVGNHLQALLARF